MRTPVGIAVPLCVAATLAAACNDDRVGPRVPERPEDLAWADLGFDYATACDVGQHAVSPPSLALVDAFPTAEAFSQPVALTHAGDGSGRLFVLERTGRVKVFHPSYPTTVTTFLDLSDAITLAGECGFLGLAFDPAFATTGTIYTSYNVVDDAGEIASILSRWHVPAPAPGGPAGVVTVDPASEQILLTVAQPYSNHKGGDIHFGPDGMLYFGLGDGGAGDDPHGNGQDLESLLGKMLRLDVRCADCANGYQIPADNPFAPGQPRAGAGRPEIWAWGLRNPWRFSFDRQTGELWAGDVGQGQWEEVDLIEGGKNYGWRTMEGTQCRPGGPDDCDQTGLTLPLLEYSHAVGSSITGGYVYRGARWPQLAGTYLFADYGAGVYFSWNRATEPPPTTPIGPTPSAIAGLGEDEAGEVYFLGIGDGRLYGLDVTASRAPAPEPPPTLSATGCFVDTASLAPAPGVLPCELALSFWSDGADKRRFIVLPEGGKVGWDAVTRWQFPTGTVFIKHFDLPTSTGTTPWETRFLIRDEGGTRGLTYRWDADGRDATLVADAGAVVPWTNPVGETADWLFPSRTQCGMCHTPEAGGVLSLEAAGLQVPSAYPWVLGGARVNQLLAWRAFGLFAPTPEVPSAETLGAVSPHPALGDASASLESRARAWLHLNCSACHTPGGTSGTNLDLRASIPLAQMNICDVPPTRGDLGLPGGAAATRILAPGAPENSVLVARIARRGTELPGQMPPLGSARIDEAGVDVVTRWVREMTGCPSP